jgi:ABC-2 type transport system ATP-binding protein
VDTPESLTSKLRGTETLYVQVDAAGAEVKTTLEAVPGVTQVALADSRGTLTGFEVNSEAGRDVRRELASAIVGRGWGLLELRPLRMSLEEIFLHLTTEEAPATAAPPEPVQEAVNE